MLDKERLIKELKNRGLEPWYLVISGSDAYGFKSENNSDIDVRGAYYYTDPDDIFNPPHPKSRTKQINYVDNGIEIDVHIHEVAKFLGLLQGSNMNALDWVFSEHTILKPQIGMELLDLYTLAYNTISISLAKCALGWTKSMYKMNWDDPKKVLHALRPLMTVLTYIKAQEYHLNIDHMAEEYFGDYKHIIRHLITLKIQDKKVPEHLKTDALLFHDFLKDEVANDMDQFKLNEDIIDYVKEAITTIRMATLNQGV